MKLTPRTKGLLYLLVWLIPLGLLWIAILVFILSK